MNYEFNRLEELQSWLFNLCYDELFIIQHYNPDNGKWVDAFGSIRDSVCDYKTCVTRLEDSQSDARMCKVSRYLTDGELVITSVVRIKNNGGTLNV
jgi:hypothetical protein